jgi:uncharacterized protein (TIGR00255 family)
VVNSMTGFGRGEHSDNGLHATVEIRSVNHRFREIAVRIPRAYLLMEEKIKNQIEGQVARGHLDVFVNIEDQREKKRNVKLERRTASRMAKISLAQRRIVPDTGRNIFGKFRRLSPDL